MSVRERDPVTGYETTGHVWNGIKELNTHVPRAVWFFIIVTHLYALVAWVLLPTWPLGETYTKGLLGADQRERLETQVANAQASRAVWTDRITAEPLDAIRADADLMRAVEATAPALFGDNCEACHGANAEGGPGYPSLVDSAWLWGGDDETVMETLRVGINSPHPDTRIAQMLAFGRDGILSRDEIRTVSAYVLSLSGGEITEDAREEGATLFVDNCESCHGEDAKGLTDVGAPDLTDDFWIYGKSDEALFRTIHGGRYGWMPAWEDRLTLAERKMLAIHIRNLAEGAAR
ncbi:MAG: cytochrome-c oxidase, cbb3-type subunit III [Paracoccaceae bacterium]